MAGAASAASGGAVRRFVARAVPPVAASVCFGYAGFEIWRNFSAEARENASLRQQLDREADELDARRVTWVEQSSPDQKKLFSGQVISEVHNPKALGPAGIFLRRGEVVDILEEGKGMEQGFHVVRASDGRLGIYPKSYFKEPGTSESAVAAEPSETTKAIHEAAVNFHAPVRN
eukprot:TRINITY_DN49880_c0_g1_i1.p1 TRINITY_DN49880_c0_g1~~TRINITY_DN49880_c0_g1_i1.p1  ORF type:complete len:184 (+),score=31.92 TRINITY_DN49880_c0_g1_i1:33-554(+)